MCDQYISCVTYFHANHVLLSVSASKHYCFRNKYNSCSPLLYILSGNKSCSTCLPNAIVYSHQNSKIQFPLTHRVSRESPCGPREM